MENLRRLHPYKSGAILLKGCNLGLMLDVAIRAKVSKVISICALLTCLIVTPNLALDPINLPKMVTLAIGSFLSLGLIAGSLKTISLPHQKKLLIFLIAFLICLFGSTFFSEASFTQSLYGAHGRNTGLLTYTSFVILMFSATLISDSTEIGKFYRYFLWAGMASTVYGLIQFLGVDPAGWDIYANPIVGFLGNTDFQAAFLAIFASSSLALGIFKSSNKFSNITFTFAAMLIAVLTQAKQGFVAFLLGSSVIVFVIAIRGRHKILMVIYALAAILGITLIGLGILDKGPIGHLVYKSSLEARFYYWQAATRMFIDNFFTGVGLDSFGEYYQRYRTQDAVTWNTQPTNAAHNVFLDYAANGGILFLGLSLILVTWVLKSFKEVIINRRDFNPYFISLFVGWVAFQAQSLISINQIGLAVWNWVISGFLIGYNLNQKYSLMQNEIINPRTKKKTIKGPKHGITNKTFFGGLAGVLISTCIALPAYLGSITYWKMINSGDLTKIANAADVWPKDEFKYWSVILTISGNASAIDEKYSNPNSPEIQSQIDSLMLSALKVTKNAVRDFPNSVHLWRLYAKNPMATIEEVKNAMMMIKKLDPNNPVL